MYKTRFQSSESTIDVIYVIGIHLEGAANTDLQVRPVGGAAFGDLLNQIDGLGKPRQRDGLVADGFFHVW